MVAVISDIIYYPEKRHKKGGQSLFRSPDCGPGQAFLISKLISLSVK